MRGVEHERPLAGAAPERPGPRAALDQDLYCLQCGYNLRGLSGDPVRCPECGFQNPLGDIELPAANIREQLRRMESAPTYSLACSLGAACLLLLLAALGPAEFLASGCLPLGLITCAVAWPLTVQRYKRSCLAKPGWGHALLRFQVAGATMIGLVVGLPLSIAWMLLRVFARGGNVPILIVVIALTFATPFAFSWVISRAYRYAKGPMESLQRQVAVDLARDVLRRRLARRR